jgi:DNA repair exonuclease SbcCD ATPase subunit
VRILEGKAELRRLKDDAERLARDAERMKTLSLAKARWEEVRERLQRLRELEERSRILRGEIAGREMAIAELARRGGALRSRLGQIKDARDRLIDLAPAEEKGRLLEEKRELSAASEPRYGRKAFKSQREPRY